MDFIFVLRALTRKLWSQKWPHKSDPWSNRSPIESADLKDHDLPPKKKLVLVFAASDKMWQGPLSDVFQFHFYLEHVFEYRMQKP